MVRKVPLGRGRFALIDDEDAAIVVENRWTAERSVRTYYAVTYASEGTKAMHRIILGLEKGDGKQVDHINGDGLDNRRANLRIATRSLNAYNRAAKKRLRGIKKASNGQTWEARIGYRGEKIYLGVYRTPEDAAKVYDLKAKELYGADARLNFPEV